MNVARQRRLLKLASKLKSERLPSELTEDGEISWTAVSHNHRLVFGCQTAA